MSLVPVPASAGGGGEPREGLQGVVQWLCEQTPEAVTANPSAEAVNRMDEEKQRFLANVLGSLQKDYLANVKVRTAVAPGRARVGTGDGGERETLRAERVAVATSTC